MNQGRIWCVVSPSVGLPLLIGSVCVTSLIVHTAVLSNANWYKSFYNGTAMRKAAVDTVSPSLAALSAPAYTVSIAPALASVSGEAAFTVSVRPQAAEPAVQAAAIRPPDATTAN